MGVLRRRALVFYLLVGTVAGIHTMNEIHTDGDTFSGLRRDSQMLDWPGKVNSAAYDHIAINAKYHNLWEQIITFPLRRPYLFQVIMATFKTWAADAVVQFAERRRRCAVRRAPQIAQAEVKFDWKRSAAFAVFGLVYVGMVQWFLYVTFFTKVFPDAIIFANLPLPDKLQDKMGQFDLIGQVFYDNFIFTCFIYFPLFYIIKEFLQGAEGGSVCRGLDSVPNGLRRYWKSILTDNLAGWAVWIPADIIVFSAPMYLRMPLDHIVSFMWTMIMSALRGAHDSKDDDHEHVEK